MLQKIRWFLLPTGGVLLGLCLIFPYIGWLEWIAAVPALCFIFSVCADRAFSLRRLYLAGLAFFFSFYFTVYYWFCCFGEIGFIEFEWGERVALVAICWVGLSLLQAAFASLLLPLFGLLCRSFAFSRFSGLFPLFFAGGVAVFEYGETLTWMGVPFARLSIGQASCGFLFNSASLFGSYFITFALIAVNGYAAYAIIRLDKVKFCAGMACGIFLLHAAAGLIGYLTAAPERGRAATVAAVQGNVGSSDKWSSEGGEDVYDLYERYTAQAAEAGATLVLFPETFIPTSITQDNVLGKYVRDLALNYEVTVVCGAFYYGENGLEYNGVFTAFPDGTLSETVYKKQRLVPFGEYVPWQSFFEMVCPPLSELNMLAEDLTPGKSSETVQTPDGKLGFLVCFDSIYEDLTLESVKNGAELICLPTNDSWFSDSAALYMHSVQARLRAVESGRWIVRCADTGISSLISPNGQNYSEVPALQEGLALGTVFFRTDRTLYDRIGNLFIYLLLFVFSGCGIYAFVLYRHTKGRVSSI